MNKTHHLKIAKEALDIFVNSIQAIGDQNLINEIIWSLQAIKVHLEEFSPSPLASQARLGRRQSKKGQTEKRTASMAIEEKESKGRTASMAIFDHPDLTCPKHPTEKKIKSPYNGKTFCNICGQELVPSMEELNN